MAGVRACGFPEDLMVLGYANSVQKFVASRSAEPPRAIVCVCNVLSGCDGGHAYCFAAGSVNDQVRGWICHM